MRRSWIEIVHEAIDRLPGPRWAAYLGIFAVTTTASVAAAIVDGLEPVPSVSPGLVAAFGIGIGMLWAIHSLGDAAVRALDGLAPLLTVDDTVREGLARDLTRTPPSWALIALVAGTLGGLESVLTTPESWGLPRDGAAATLAVGLVLGPFNTTMLAAFAARLLHQVRVIRRIHARAVRIDLRRLEPTYEFAAFTARAVVTYLAIGIGGLVLVAFILGGFFTPVASDLVLFSAMIAVSIFSFVAPTLGLHARISAAKDERLGAVHADQAMVQAEFSRRVAGGDLEGAGRLGDALAAATAIADAASRIPTWPWRPETLRAFVSAVLLPIALWVAVTVLERAFGA